MKELPIPSLEETYERYIKHITPLLSKEELQNSKQVLKNFFEKDAIVLQSLLEEEKEISDTSWLYKYWLDLYLACKGSVNIDANFCMNLIFPSDLKKLSNEKLLNNFSKALGKLCQDFSQNNFEEPIDARGTKLCQNQFQILKGSCRIPSFPKDSYHINHTTSNYITIFYKDNLYKIEIFDEKGIFDIEDTLNEILKNSIQSDSLL